MKFKNIEVNGIKHIVFNREHKWTFNESTGDWFEEFNGRSMTHHSLMWVVGRLKENRRYRMWIHLDTLNVVRK